MLRLFSRPLLLLIALSLIPPAWAQDMATIETPVEQALRRLQPDLRLAGQGTLRMFGLRIYQVRLFVSPRGLPGDTLTGLPYALDLYYARAFRGADIARRTRTEMEALGQGSPADREQWEAQLLQLFPDVRENDHLSGLYQPDVGTIFLLNGRRIGVMPGDKFARAFFSIWLDPRTAAPAVRQALLAGSRPTGAAQ